METPYVIAIVIAAVFAILLAIGVLKWAIMWSLGMTDLITSLSELTESIKQHQTHSQKKIDSLLYLQKRNAYISSNLLRGNLLALIRANNKLERIAVYSQDDPDVASVFATTESDPELMREDFSLHEQIEEIEKDSKRWIRFFSSDSDYSPDDLDDLIEYGLEDENGLGLSDEELKGK